MPSASRLDGMETDEVSGVGMGSRPTGVTPPCIVGHAAPKQQAEAGAWSPCSPQPSWSPEAAGAALTTTVPVPDFSSGDADVVRMSAGCGVAGDAATVFEASWPVPWA